MHVKPAWRHGGLDQPCLIFSCRAHAPCSELTDEHRYDSRALQVRVSMRISVPHRYRVRALCRVAAPMAEDRCRMESDEPSDFIHRHRHRHHRSSTPCHTGTGSQRHTGQHLYSKSKPHLQQPRQQQKSMHVKRPPPTPMTVNRKKPNITSPPPPSKPQEQKQEIDKTTASRHGRNVTNHQARSAGQKGLFPTSRAVSATRRAA